jgi:hypothetical protein
MHYGASSIQLNTPFIGPVQTLGGVHDAAAHVQVTVPPHAAGIGMQP